MNIHKIAKQIRSFADELEAAKPEQPDPYAELKKAHTEGKKIEFFDGCEWNDAGSPSWICTPERYRIKPDEIPWTEWHGGECPLRDEEVEEWEYKLDSGVHIEEPCEGPSAYAWGVDGDGIVAYRVLKTRKPKPKVPLGKDDVPPFSVFRVKGEGSSGWHQMKICPQWDGLIFSSDVSLVSYEELKRNWLINRSIPMSGKWNPDAWENCEK
jgi:hypothetical protein